MGECTGQEYIWLESLQNEAAIIVKGLTRSVSLVNLYNGCGWDSHIINLQKKIYVHS